MPATLNLALQLTGSDQDGAIAPFNINLGLSGGRFQDFEADVPATGPDVVVQVPQPGSTQQMLLIRVSNPCEVKINAETVARELSPGGIYLIVGGPVVTQLTFTPNGSTEVNATIKALVTT